MVCVVPLPALETQVKADLPPAERPDCAGTLREILEIVILSWKLFTPELKISI